MQLPDLNFFQILGLVVAAAVIWKILRFLSRLFKQLRAYNHYQKYIAERDALYYQGQSNPTPSAPRDSVTPWHAQGQENTADPDFYKDKDARVRGMAEPQGFWTKLVMGEKIHLIREMIRIANSSEHRGYWQDRIEAQKRVEGQGQQIGDDRGR
jgi:hypothetical protein